MTSDRDRPQGLTQIAGASAASFGPTTGSVSNTAGADPIGPAGGTGPGGGPRQGGADVTAPAAGPASTRATTSADKRRERDIGDEFGTNRRKSPKSPRDFRPGGDYPPETSWGLVLPAPIQ